MGRRIKIGIPQVISHLASQWHFLPDFQQKSKMLIKQKIMIIDIVWDKQAHYLMIHQCGWQLATAKLLKELCPILALLDLISWLLLDRYTETDNILIKDWAEQMADNFSNYYPTWSNEL